MAYAAGQLIRACVLDEIAARTSGERLKDVLAVGGDGQNDDLNAGTRRDDPWDRVDASQARHVQVDHHHVGRQLACERDCLGAVYGLAHDGQAVTDEHAAQALAKEVVVVGEHHSESLLGWLHKRKIDESGAACEPV